MQSNHGPDQVLMDHAHEVWHLQFSRQGHMLASASADGTLIFWDVLLGRRRVALRHSIKAHSQQILFVAWHPTDALLATCSWDCTVKLWDPQTGHCKETFTHHTQGVEAVAWLPDGADPGSALPHIQKLSVREGICSMPTFQICRQHTCLLNAV
jgi:WD40 repeat protein